MRILTTAYRQNTLNTGEHNAMEMNIEFTCRPAEVAQVQALYGQEVTLLPGRVGVFDRNPLIAAGARKRPKELDCKVIYNAPYTILYMNGEKYISKAHNEEFDEEKGLLMCLAKANGITHLQLKRMIKNAKRQGIKK